MDCRGGGICCGFRDCGSGSGENMSGWFLWVLNMIKGGIVMCVISLIPTFLKQPLRSVLVFLPSISTIFLLLLLLLI